MCQPNEKSFRRLSTLQLTHSHTQNKENKQTEIILLKNMQYQHPETSRPTLDQCNCSRKKVKNYISYKKIYDAHGKHRIFWIPNQPVKISIQNVPDNAKMIRINLEHGKFKWTTEKNSQQLKLLNRWLKRDRMVQKIPRPKFRKSHDKPENFAHEKNCPYYQEHVTQSKKIRPNFKKLNYPPLNDENQRMLNQNFENWIGQMLNSNIYRHYDEMKKFLEVSPYSFLNEFGTKNQEGMVRLRYIKDNKFNIKNMKDFLLRLFFPWKIRWLLVKDSFIAFIDPKKKYIRGIILLGEGFEVNKSDLRNSIHGPKEFIISYIDQDLRIKCSTVNEAQRWQTTFDRVLQSTGSIWLQPKRFRSTFPQRQNNFCQPLVDGEAFYEKIADMIELAKDEIFICSWWICPELYMKRPMVEGNKWRLDQCLLRAAKRGVHVFILQYNELHWAFGHNSIYGKRFFKKLHKNIMIMRHPDHFSDQGTIKWAHHEKFLVVDQSIGFIGGTDLCFGRWDNEKHPLKDLGSLVYVPEKFSQKLKFEVNPIIVPEEIREDIAVLKESPQEDVEILKEVINVDVENLSESGDSIENYRIKFNFLEKTRFNIKELRGCGLLHPGKEYVNLNVHDFEEVDKPFIDQIDRYTVPRLPWHDVNAVVFGEAARDLARHFIQRWNATKAEKFRRDRDYTYLLPKSYDNMDVPDFLLNDKTFKCEVQVVRSVAEWSIGVDRKEQSILNAYKELIANSKHYVYMENLYFVSMIDSEDVSNGICEVLCDRIVKADKSNENFRAYINLPLRPGYAGDIKKDVYSTLNVLMNLNYTSLMRGPNSLFENLKKNGVGDPWKYISVTSLRTYENFCGKLETEMVYIHTKAMIVDDLHVILGSANINDRSMLGDRDSEVDVVITDEEFVDTKMEGKEYKAGKFAFSMRQRLMKEYLGMLPGMPEPIKSEEMFDIEDPVRDEFFQDVWKFHAKKNTRIYEEVFHTFPTDKTETYDELETWRAEEQFAQREPETAEEKLKEIVGYLIEFPLNFLKQENLSPEIGTQEYLVPTEVYS